MQNLDFPVKTSADQRIRSIFIGSLREPHLGLFRKPLSTTWKAVFIGSRRKPRLSRDFAETKTWGFWFFTSWTRVVLELPDKGLSARGVYGLGQSYLGHE